MDGEGCFSPSPRLEDTDKVTVAFLVALGGRVGGARAMFLVREAVRLAVDGMIAGLVPLG